MSEEHIRLQKYIEDGMFRSLKPAQGGYSKNGSGCSIESLGTSNFLLIMCQPILPFSFFPSSWLNSVSSTVDLSSFFTLRFVCLLLFQRYIFLKRSLKIARGLLWRDKGDIIPRSLLSYTSKCIDTFWITHVYNIVV